MKTVIFTNKLLNELFNYVCMDEEIKKCNNKYSYSYIFKDGDYNTLKITISSSNREYLKFSIYEKIMFFMLISNAKSSNNIEDYFISMRKLRDIRGIDSNSLNTYMCYENSLKGLSSKEIKIIPLKCKYNYKPINSKLLIISNEVRKGKRISEFNYSFDKLEEMFVNSKQFITLSFSPFSISFKKSFKMQLFIHLLRLVFINSNKNVRSREFSLQKILMQLKTVDSSGYFTNINYYEYLQKSANKQSERLNNMYKDIIDILSLMKKHKLIYKYSLSERKSFKYLRDNEVQIMVIFNK